MKLYLNRSRDLLTISVLTFFAAGTGFAQSISGYVYDENNSAVPFANIFIRELENGTASDDKGHYFLNLDPGVYNIVVSSIGFHPYTTQVIVKDKALVLDFRLQSSSVELNEIEIKVRRRDPAYEIIQKVIDNKEKFRSQITSSRTSIYVRASETVDEKKRREKQHDEEPEETKKGGPPIDPVEAARKKEEARLEKINLVEMQILLNYQYPDRYKEERTAYKAYGSRDGLFIPIFGRADFNFYHNLVDLKGISEIPLISPVSRTAVLSYRFKLEDVLKESSGVVYKIKVTPRKTGDATCSGHLFVNDSTWNINRLELTMHKGGLKFYDDFTIKQTYEEVDKDIWIPFRQEFVYSTKSGGKLFRGSTVMVYSNFENNYVFPTKFFGNELAVTKKEAYERDSAYWNDSRPEPLTPDQKKMVAYRDSVEAVHKSKAYIDSVEAKYNRITLGEVVYHGIGLRSSEKKRNIWLPSLVSMINFEVIGGFRLGPSGGMSRSFENGRMLNTFNYFSVGLKNRDLNGYSNLWVRYDPYRLGDASITIGRSFHSINSFDAYLNQLSISNYILNKHVDLHHRIELFNGFYLGTDLNFASRESLKKYDNTSILNEVIEEDAPLDFDDYQALISHVSLAYVPGQKYMTEPNRKVVLGSKYPTFIFNHRKGWNRLLTSDIDFDYIDLTITQNLLLGTLGNSRYTVMAGKFVNKRDLRFVDVKRFRQSDPYLYSNPLYSFQLLDTALFATDWFIEGHYIHHFNGALINNIPLIKKLKLRTVAGAGFMWIKENNFRHEEIFGGLERIFKVGPRRRLKIGAYGVVSQSNFAPARADWKISFDLIDTWKREWSY